MNIHTGNIKIHLTTLTSTQLKKELTRVSHIYQGWQVNDLSKASYESWQTYISLIEEEIDRRG